MSLMDRRVATGAYPELATLHRRNARDELKENVIWEIGQWEPNGKEIQHTRAGRGELDVSWTGSSSAESAPIRKGQVS